MQKNKIADGSASGCNQQKSLKLDHIDVMFLCVLENTLSAKTTGEIPEGAKTRRENVKDYLKDCENNLTLLFPLVAKKFRVDSISVDNLTVRYAQPRMKMVTWEGGEQSMKNFLRVYAPELLHLNGKIRRRDLRKAYAENDVIRCVCEHYSICFENDGVKRVKVEWV